MSKTRNPDALIRIEDAIKVLCRETCHPGMLCPDNYCVEMWDAFKDVERVDAVPVAHSEWIPKEKADTPYGLEMECAKCGFSVIVNDALYFKFCPNCGAKMDGKDGDGNG